MTPLGRRVLADIGAAISAIDAAAYEVCGLIDRAGTIYPLGSDTKVLSTAFELIARPFVYTVAKRHRLSVVEAAKQNFYPDFTLLRGEADPDKIAIDVKTTYRDTPESRFHFTLGGYTSFIRNPTKNIAFPFDQYSDHLIIGFAYGRAGKKKAAATHTYRVDQLAQIEIPVSSVTTFVQEKWRIASDRAGSGNTTNIGSISGLLADFANGRGVFRSEAEFLEYWRDYGRTSADRTTYRNIAEFRDRKRRD